MLVKIMMGKINNFFGEMFYCFPGKTYPSEKKLVPKTSESRIVSQTLTIEGIYSMYESFNRDLHGKNQ